MGEINCKSCYTYCCHMIKIFDKMKQISFVTKLSLFFCFFLPYITNAIEHSFVNVETDFHKIHRNLLQDDTSISDGLDETPLDENVQKEVKEEEKEEPIVFKGLAEPGEYKLGPRLFFDSKEFLMRLGAPIRVTIFPSPGEEEGGGKLSTVDLNAEAVSVKGSMIDEHSFKVKMNWKFRPNMAIKWLLHLDLHFAVTIQVCLSRKRIPVSNKVKMLTPLV